MDLHDPVECRVGYGGLQCRNEPLPVIGKQVGTPEECGIPEQVRKNHRGRLLGIQSQLAHHLALIQNPFVGLGAYLVVPEAAAIAGLQLLPQPNPVGRRPGHLTKRLPERRGWHTEMHVPVMGSITLSDDRAAFVRRIPGRSARTRSERYLEQFTIRRVTAVIKTHEVWPGLGNQLARALGGLT